MAKVGFYKDEDVVPLEMHKVGTALCYSQVVLAASCPKQHVHCTVYM
jgi:hypothetical protein